MPFPDDALNATPGGILKTYSDSKSLMLFLPNDILIGAIEILTARLGTGFPDGLLKKASTEPLTTNQHHKGVTPEDFQSSGLGKIFRRG